MVSDIAQPTSALTTSSGSKRIRSEVLDAADDDESKSLFFRLKNLQLRKIIKENHGDPVACAVFNNMDKNEKRRKLVATCGSDQVNIYDNHHSGNNLDLACHFVNEKTQYSTGGDVNVVCWLNLENAAENEALVAFGGEGKFVGIISVADSMVISQLEGHTAAVVALSTVPNHPNLLLSASEDNTVRLWNTKTTKTLAIYQVGGGCSLAVNPNGEYFVTGSTDGNIRKWDISSVVNGTEDAVKEMDAASCDVIQEFPSLKTRIDCVKFFEMEVEPNLKKIMLAAHSKKGKLNILDMTQNEVLRKLTIPDDSKIATRKDFTISQRFDVSKCGRYLCVGNSIGNVFLYELATGRRFNTLELKRVRGGVTNCMFTPNGESILLSTDDSILWRWDFVNPNKEAENDAKKLKQ